MRPRELDIEYFQREYYGKRRSTEELGRELGCSGRGIRERMAALGLKTDEAMLKRGRPVKSPPPRHGKLPPVMYGADHPNWKGGRYRASSGHIYQLARTHPHANAQGYVLEHRLVVEQALGRLLDRTEIVHHRNHDPADNRPENLEVMTRNQHQWHHRRHNATARQG